MRKPDFERIASLIVKKFPNETASTYYIKASKKVRARGKLYDSYQHLRSDLIKVGLATKNVYIRRGDQIESDEIDEIVDENQSKIDLEFLEAHAAPWDEVTIIWSRTWDARQKILKDTSVVEYLNSYPSLCTNRGLELVSH